MEMFHDNLVYTSQNHYRYSLNAREMFGSKQECCF